MNFALGALAPLLILSQSTGSPFNGTWVIDVPSTVKDARLKSISVKQGIFSRGDPGSLAVRADGRFHPLASDGYVDAVAVTISGRSVVHELDRFMGMLAYSITYAVAADRNTMTRKVVDFSKPDCRPIPTTIVHRRVGQPPREGSLVSGQWKTLKIVTTQAHLTEVLTLVGNRLSSLGPGGTGYDAIISGPAVPIRGDAADARVAVTMPNDRSIVLSMSGSDGLSLSVTMILAMDNRTINAEGLRLKDGTKINWTMYKR